MHCTLWYHCSKDTSVFPGMASPLNVLIFRVPDLNPVARVLRSHPMSSSIWGILQAVSPAHEVSIPSPWKGHFPTVSASIGSSTSTSYQAHTGGVTASLLAVSKQTSDNTSQSWASSRSLRAKWKCCWVPHHWVRWKNQIPTWDWCRGARGMPIPHGDIFLNLCSCRWLGTEPNGVIT